MLDYKMYHFFPAEMISSICARLLYCKYCLKSKGIYFFNIVNLIIVVLVRISQALECYTKMVWKDCWIFNMDAFHLLFHNKEQRFIIYKVLMTQKLQFLSGSTWASFSGWCWWKLCVWRSRPRLWQHLSKIS